MSYQRLVANFLVIFSMIITVYLFTITNNIYKHNPEKPIPIKEKLTKKECLPTKHSICFLNKRFCHPGYTNENCDIKLVPANPWYISNCPNLNKEITYDLNTPLNELSNGQDCDLEKISDITGCAYLCK